MLLLTKALFLYLKDDVIKRTLLRYKSNDKSQSNDKSHRKIKLDYRQSFIRMFLRFSQRT